jgi:hypothetical protein
MDFPTEKQILNSVILKVYTKVPQLSKNSSLVPDSEFHFLKKPLYIYIPAPRTLKPYIFLTVTPFLLIFVPKVS